MLIIDTLRQCLAAIPRFKNIWIAYSGGVDSHVLLHAISQLQKDFPESKLVAVHINHGLLAQAGSWVEHSLEVCRKLNITCKIINVEINRQDGESLESLAREARYRVLEELLETDDVLLTAHHLDDQAETCLLQFLRGSGPKGLASMPNVVEFAQGFLARPFLSISRQIILRYAEQHDFCWIEDDSNHDLTFTRNFLRYQIMPLLKERWSNISQTIMRVTKHSAEADQLLHEMAELDLLEIKGDVAGTLSISKLKKLSYVRQKNVLRTWLYKQDILLPSTLKLQHLIQDVVNSRIDASPCVRWGVVEIRRYADNLYILQALEDFDFQKSFKWDGKSALLLPADIGFLKSEAVQGEGVKCCLNNDEFFTVKFRQGGERCRLPGRKGTHKVKKLLQEWRVPPWKRNKIPLIFKGNQLVMIVGYAICEAFVARENENGLNIWIEQTLFKDKHCPAFV